MKQKYDSRGVILLAVFFVLLALSLVTLSILTMAQYQTRLANRELATARASAAADAAIYEAIARLATARGPLTGVTQYLYAINDQTVDVLIQPEIGKFDLNTGEEEWLSLLFGFYGAEPEFAFDLAKAVTSARAEPDGNFVSVAQLQAIEGLPISAYRCINELLTVYSRREEPDLRFANKALFDAIQWGSAHNWGTTDWKQFGVSTTPPVSVMDQNRTNTGETFTITAHSRLGESASISRQATILITGDPKRPYWVYRWSNYYASEKLDCEASKQMEGAVMPRQSRGRERIAKPFCARQNVSPWPRGRRFRTVAQYLSCEDRGRASVR